MKWGRLALLEPRIGRPKASRSPLPSVVVTGTGEVVVTDTFHKRLKYMNDVKPRVVP